MSVADLNECSLRVQTIYDSSESDNRQLHLYWVRSWEGRGRNPSGLT